MKTENINLDGLVLGRAASIIASKLLAGYNINAYNVEKLLITGDSKLLLERYTERLNYKGKGNPNKGPHFSKFPVSLFKRTVRRMLPHQKARGIEALKRLRIYTGTIENVEFKTYPEASFKGSKRFIELGALCKKLGARW